MRTAAEEGGAPGRRSRSEERDEDEKQERGDEGVLDGGGEDGGEDEQDLQQQRGASPGEHAGEHDGRGVGGLRGQQVAPPDLRERREGRALPLLVPLRRGPAVPAGGRAGDREAAGSREERGGGGGWVEESGAGVRARREAEWEG